MVLFLFFFFFYFRCVVFLFFFFFQAEDGIRDLIVTGVQTCALPISPFCGLPSSSRTTSSSFRPPSTPPLALISSMAIRSPRLVASPEAAEPPDTAAESPILTGSLDWASAGPAVVHATASRMVSIAERRLMRILLGV